MPTVPKPLWYIAILIIISGISVYIGATAHVDVLQFDQILTTNNKIHDLEIKVAVLDTRVKFLSDLYADLRSQHLQSGFNYNQTSFI